MHLTMFCVRLLPRISSSKLRVVCKLRLPILLGRRDAIFRVRGIYSGSKFLAFLLLSFSFTFSVGSRISIFSTVNMLLKASFSAFALSHGDTALVPSGLSSVEIAALVFNLDFDSSFSLCLFGSDAC